MKVRVLAAMALLTAASGSFAAEPPAFERENAVMLYFQKSLGATDRRRAPPLRMGLRLQQDSPVGRSMRVDWLDLRFTGRTRATFLNGTLSLNSFDSGEDDDEDDSSEKSSEASSGDPTESWKERKGLVLTVTGLAALGLACALEWGICKKDDEPEVDYDPEPITPNPG